MTFTIRKHKQKTTDGNGLLMGSIDIGAIRYGGPESSMRCSLRKYMQMDEAQENQFNNVRTHGQHLENAAKEKT